VRRSRRNAEALAARVSAALRRRGLDAVLTGGSCVSIYSEGKYVSGDLDFVVTPDDDDRLIAEALAEVGFVRSGRVYSSPDTDLTVDILSPPLSVGSEPVRQVIERRVRGNTLRLLSPTDCVKDRLAAFYHWRDRQALEQAILVSLACRVDRRELRRWSKVEAMLPGYGEFSLALARARRGRHNTG